MSAFSTSPHKQTDPAKAPGVIKNDITLADYIARKTEPGSSDYDKGWNAALEMVGKYVNTVYPQTVLEESDLMWCAALDTVTQLLDKEKK